MQRWARVELCPALGLFRFPEALEVLADRLDADAQPVADALQPAQRGDEVDGVATGRNGFWIRGFPKSSVLCRSTRGTPERAPRWCLPTHVGPRHRRRTERVSSSPGCP